MLGESGECAPASGAKEGQQWSVEKRSFTCGSERPGVHGAPRPCLQCDELGRRADVALPRATTIEAGRGAHVWADAAQDDAC
jgi:hypothetical protein